MRLERGALAQTGSVFDEAAGLRLAAVLLFPTTSK